MPRRMRPYRDRLALSGMCRRAFALPVALQVQDPSSNQGLGVGPAQVG